MQALKELNKVAEVESIRAPQFKIIDFGTSYFLVKGLFEDKILAGSAMFR
jgi:hypothetical protein